MTAMPSPASPLPRKKRNTKKGISRQQNFKPALKAINSLVLDLENSENPEDNEIVSKIHDQKSLLASPNVTTSNSRTNGQESTASRGLSPDSFLRINALLEEFDGDSGSEDNEDDLEERSETRTLTEVKRLEEAQTALEDKIKEVKELLQRTDRTRNQRIQGQQKLLRLESKLEMLDQRLEAERAGKNRWTFVKRVVRKPNVGFHSSELLNRKVSLGLLAASHDTKSRLADAVPEMERKNKDVQLGDNPPPKPKKVFKSKALQEFHLSLHEESQNERKEASLCDDVGVGSSRDEWCRSNSGKVKVLEESTGEGHHGSDRKEIDKGWLRISDRPKGFVKQIDIPETHQTKEAWITINEHGQQMFARKVFRAHTNGTDPLLSRSLDERAKSTLGVRGEKRNIDNRRASKSSSENGFGGKAEKSKEGVRVGRISSSRSQRAQVVKMENIGGTTSFIPPIPKSEAKKRPKQEQVEKLTDKHDKELKKERMILIPNRKRVAKRRAEMYLKQLNFVKAHGLDQKEVLKNVGSAIQEHNNGEEELNEHQPKTNPRSTLYLIGALSRHHLRPPTAPQLNDIADDNITFQYMISVNYMTMSGGRTMPFYQKDSRAWSYSITVQYTS